MAFNGFIKQKLGKFWHFCIYAILEWVMIIVLFIDGFLSFFSNEFAKLFELRNPCLLCTRIDHVLVHREKSFYYNESICDVHKKDISALAYCHMHKKLSNIKKMCEPCLVSFATRKDSDCDRYKSLVGILKKDIDCFVEEDDQRLYTTSWNNRGSNKADQKCSCCREPLKGRVHSKYYSRNNSISCMEPLKSRVKPSYSRSNSISGSYLQTPTTTPRVSWKNEEAQNMENNLGREDLKVITSTLLPDSDDFENDRTPTNFSKGGRFFGISLSDSAYSSPRRRTRKIPHEKIEFSPEFSDFSSTINGDSIVHELKKQVFLDRKSLIDLYMELDEERSASAIAANNAMAMITRLQAEKASVQMEALQYQRLMDEQAEYDQEAFQILRDTLLKREEDIKVLESELEAFREKYGDIKKVGSEICEIDDDQDYQAFSEKSEMDSPHKEYLNQESDNYFKNIPTDSSQNNESSLDFEGERSHLLSLLMDLEKKMVDPIEEEYISSNIYPKNESKIILTREVSMIRERLRAIEAASGFLKHAAMTLQKGSEGAQLLMEIAEHLRKLRNPLEMSSKELLS